MSYIFVPAPENYPGTIYQYGNRILEHHLVWWLSTGLLVPDGYVLHHKDEDPTNNEFSNLELMLEGDHIRHHNTQHTIARFVCRRCGNTFDRNTRVISDGSKHIYCSKRCSALSTSGRCRLSEDMKEKVRLLRISGGSTRSISRELGISRNTVMKYWGI